MSDRPEVIWVHCNDCGRETRHVIVASRRQRRSELVDDRFELTWVTTYEMLECQGCESICVRRVVWFSEEPQEETVSFYPPPAERRTPNWVSALPEEMQDLLLEVYAALHADSRRLSLMGARALLDLYLQKAVGDVGGFVQKLNALQKAGHISKVNREILEAALDAGHAAAHRGYAASPEQLNAVMDIVENVIQSSLLHDVAQEIRKGTPLRPESKNEEKGDE